MKKTIIKSVSILLVFLLTFSVSVSADTSKSYTIVSPYEDVIWSGDGAWSAYKGNLHTHSTISDASVDNYDMIMEYYRQGFDFLAMTDHAVTGKEWNEVPNSIPLYWYQYIIGNKVTYLTDEEYEAVTTGTYPVDGVARGYGMTCVAGGNELNGLTITKDHVNGMFMPTYAGNNYLGFENDYEGAVSLCDYYGGISFINHPGDRINSAGNRAACSDPDTVNYIADILLRYDSCIGMEVFNELNHTTPYDRDLWDNLLMTCLPYGKNVIAFSNSDAHTLDRVDATFSVFMMEENTVENIKETMQSGSFFCVTRCLREDPDKFGPDTELDAANQGLAYPMFNNISVDGHKITVSFNEANNLMWVANGNVIAEVDYEQTSDYNTYTIDLDTIEGSEDFLYVRCQLIGEGGVTLTQAFTIDDGTEPLTYERDESFSAVLTRIGRQILGLRIFVLFKLIIDKIFG